MNFLALIVKAAVAVGIGWYLYSEVDVNAWLAAIIGAVIFGLAYIMNWDGNSPSNSGGP